MIVNQANLHGLTVGYSTAFNKSFDTTQSNYQKVATVVPSTTGEQDYKWLGQMPGMREWIGEREVQALAAYDYLIKNKKFEMTIGVPRDDIEDDKYGVYTPLFSNMGEAAALHPDELVFGAMMSGFNEKCYDGLSFFNTAHKVGDATYSNRSNKKLSREGDRFTFSSTSPAMSNESVISAVESLINSPLMFEFVHIVGVSSKALWASLCTIANDFLTKYKRPLFFVCEARGKKADESLEDYVNAMLEERKGINNIYMQVVCSNSRYQRMDGRVQDINNAGIVTGLYGRAKESQSIGEVKSFPISEAKLLKLLPEGIEDYIETLDKAKYVTIRQYIGKEDYYVTSANMMSPEGSDYSYAEDVRVSNRLVKAVRAKALDELQVEVDPEDIETSITNIQEQLNTPVEDAVRDKIISSGSVTIDTENLNILVDENDRRG